MTIRPCPICLAPHGFHDEGPHDALTIPRASLLPLTSEQRGERNRARSDAYAEWLAAQPIEIQREHAARRRAKGAA